MNRAMLRHKPLLSGLWWGRAFLIFLSRMVPV